MQARLGWLKAARPSQLTPPGRWRIWLVLAGRGWGKSRTGAEDLAHYALWHPGARLAIVAPTWADARDICVEGESGLLRCLPRRCVQSWQRSQGMVRLGNGSRIRIFSADRPERLRGPQHHRVWCDELGAWHYPEAFDQVLFGLRLGDDPRLVITTTPRPTALLRDLVARAGRDVVLTRGRTADNGANLAPGMVAELERLYAGTRLGRQELEAELIALDAGGLWQETTLADCVVASLPPLARVVVAVDPALGGRDGDETGIIAAGLGEDGFYYVLADESGVLASEAWGARAAALARRWRAERIRVEVNAGGELLTRLLRHHAPEIACEAVHAARGKWERAVPVAALYEQRRVRHGGGFPALTDQMLDFTPETIARRSPDRVDALVWALSALLARDAAQPVLRFL